MSDNTKCKTFTLVGLANSREVYINGLYLSPTPSQMIRNHSPDGFNWGYGGSGPAQLALAIAMKLWEMPDASFIYQDLKFRVIAALPSGKDFDVSVFYDPDNPEMTEIRNREA